MEAIIASAIAVLGTLLGSGITLAFQQRTTEKGHQFARDERLRQERLDAYSIYAGALVNYRRCLVHLWFCLHEQPPPRMQMRYGSVLSISALAHKRHCSGRRCSQTT